MTLTLGSRLGPYEILSPLGAGGMGEVWRARDTRLGRDVAIKVLPAHLSSSPEMRQRFEREAKTISALSHPHVCALYDVGNQDGVEYLVMELLEGETLADRLARGPLPLEQALRYGMEIADALDKAHRRGIVHRDLKPGNVMLTGSGVKVLDFGLARMVEPVASKSELSVLPTAAPGRPLTQEGTILGTLQYMAPEQVEGKEADARTDIFAFGAVLYEMATGQKAFAGSSRASLISAILRDEPQPVSRIQPMSPPALDRVVRRCLAKEPERRWQSARDAALELEEAAKAPEASEAASPRAFTRIATVSGWAIAVLLLILLAGTWLWPGRARRPAPERALRFTIPPPSGASFEGMLALSPDGRTLAFVATAADGRDLLFLRPLDALESRALPGTDGAAYPFWSPDGHAIAFFTPGKLKRIEAVGGAPQTLSNVLSPRGGSWSSHGTIVFSADSGGQVRYVSESGGESHPVGSLASRSGETYRWPSFLPDGRHFLYFTFAGEQPQTGVAVASLDSNETAFLFAADSGAVYAPPGFLLYRRGDNLMAQSFDTGRLHVSGDAVPIVDDVWWDGTSTLATAFTVSPGSLIAYQTGGLNQSRLLLYDRAGREIRQIDLSGAYFEPALSPDGRRVAVARAEARGSAIWMVDLERGSFSRFSSETELSDASPLWTPDGRNVLYAVYPGGEVYQRDAAGAEKEKLLFRFPAFSPLDDLSRDGRYLLYESVNWPTFHFDLFLRDLRDGSNRPLLKEVFNQLGARFSPDGRWLAYESEESGVREVFVRSYPGPGERRQVSAGGGTQPRWRGDGKEVFYVSPDRKLMAMDVQTQPSLDSGPPHALFQTRILPTVETRNQYDASADGQRFIVNSRRPEDAALPITVVVGWVPGPRK